MWHFPRAQASIVMPSAARRGPSVSEGAGFLNLRFMLLLTMLMLPLPLSRKDLRLPHQPGFVPAFASGVPCVLTVPWLSPGP